MDAQPIPALSPHDRNSAAPLSSRHPRATLLRPGTLALFLTVIVLAVNFPVLDFDWLMFDDDINILVNPHLGCRAQDSFGWAFENVDYMRRYLPLGWTSFAGILALDGYNPAVFHAVNWLLTALNAVLMFFLLGRLLQKLPSTSTSPVTPRLLAAALGALFWALHPLRVENVAWISGLLYVGSTTFALAAVIVHLRASAAPSRRAVSLRIAATLLYLGSVLVYPVHLALPAVIACGLASLSPAPFLATLRRELKHTAGWWLAAAFSAGMNAFARATASDAYGLPSGTLSIWEGCLGTLHTLAHYLSRTLWPGDLSAYYGTFGAWLAQPAQQLALGLALLLAALGVALPHTRRGLLLCAALAAMSLAPFLAQLDRSFHPSDRYSVLWLAVWAVALAACLARPLRPTTLRLARLTVLIVLGLFVAHSRHLLPNWKDTAALQASLDRHASSHPNVQLHYVRAAVAFWWLGDRTAWQRKLDEAAARFPGHPALAGVQATLRELDARYRARVGSQPDIPPLAVLHVDLGRSWQARRHPPAAAAHFARALHLAPDYAEARDGWLRARVAR